MFRLLFTLAIITIQNCDKIDGLLLTKGRREAQALDIAVPQISTRLETKFETGSNGHEHFDYGIRYEPVLNYLASEEGIANGHWVHLIELLKSAMQKKPLRSLEYLEEFKDSDTTKISSLEFMLFWYKKAAAQLVEHNMEATENFQNNLASFTYVEEYVKFVQAFEQDINSLKGQNSFEAVLADMKAEDLDFLADYTQYWSRDITPEVARELVTEESSFYKRYYKQDDFIIDEHLKRVVKDAESKLKEFKKKVSSKLIKKIGGQKLRKLFDQNEATDEWLEENDIISEHRTLRTLKEKVQEATNAVVDALRLALTGNSRSVNKEKAKNLIVKKWFLDRGTLVYHDTLEVQNIVAVLITNAKSLLVRLYELPEPLVKILSENFGSDPRLLNPIAEVMKSAYLNLGDVRRDLLKDALSSLKRNGEIDQALKNKILDLIVTDAHTNGSELLNPNSVVTDAIEFFTEKNENAIWTLENVGAAVRRNEAGHMPKLLVLKSWLFPLEVTVLACSDRNSLT